MKGYREKYVVSNAWNAGAKDLEFIENDKSSLILFFAMDQVVSIILTQKQS